MPTAKQNRATARYISGMRRMMLGQRTLSRVVRRGTRGSMAKSTPEQTTREIHFADALDRIARFGEAYEAATDKLGHDGLCAGPALAVTMGRYARKVLNER